MQEKVKVSDGVELFVGGLNSVLTEADVIQYVKTASGVTPLAVKLIYDQKTLTLKRFCFLSLASQEDAAKIRVALAKQGLKVGDAKSAGTHRGPTENILLPQTSLSTIDRLMNTARVSGLGKPYVRFLVTSYRLLVAKLKICIAYHKQHEMKSNQSSLNSGFITTKRLNVSLYELISQIRTIYDLLECLEHGNSESSPLNYYNERWMLKEPPIDAPILDQSHLWTCVRALKGAMRPEDGMRTSGKKALSTLLQKEDWRIAVGPVDVPIYVFDVEKDEKTKDEDGYITEAFPLIIVPLETSFFQPRRLLLPRQITSPFPLYYSVNPDTPERACFAFGKWNGEEDG